MSGNWQQQPQYKPDVEQADQQVGVVNSINAVQDMLNGMPFGGRVRFFGTTDFENHELNDMIDLVDHANPDHLELAGKALWDARKAISDAADELSGHIGRVEWEGEAADAFRTWGADLVTWTRGLADFADAAATQITAAGMGLASVRSAMPPRDTRSNPTPLKDIPKAKQVDSNAEYTAALKVEQHRQEAINQMNRLSSFYSVSAEALKGQKEPTPFKAMPDVGMPRPTQKSDDLYFAPGADDHGSVSGDRGTAEVSGHHMVTTSSEPRSAGHASPLKDLHDPLADPDRHVSTKIDSLGTVPVQTPTAPHGLPTSSVPTIHGVGGEIPPFSGGPMTPPIVPSVSRSPGYGAGARLPASAQGRTGTPGGAAGGRVPQGPANQAGRTPATGRTTPAGEMTVKGTAQQAETPPQGRGVTGGTPRTTKLPSERAGGASATGQARSGVVGGRPLAGPTPRATTNPRLPRGMVIGAEEPAASQPTNRGTGQSGVIGAPTAKAQPGAGQAALRRTSNGGGVIGSPRGGAASAIPDSGLTTGGTGGVRGPVGDRSGTGRTTNRSGAPAGSEQHGPSQKQRRTESSKSD